MTSGAIGGPGLAGDDLAELKTAARRLVSLLHQPVIRMGEVGSTVQVLVELTSLLRVHENAKTYTREGAYPSEDRADQEVQGASGRASERVAESEETPEEDPQVEDLIEDDPEQLTWLDDEAWSG